MSNYSNLTHWPHCEVIWYHRMWSTLVQAIASCLMSPSHYLHHCRLIVSWAIWNILEWNFNQNAIFFRKCIWKCCLQNVSHFCSGLSRIMIRKLHYHQRFSAIYCLKWKCHPYDEISICCTGSCQMSIFNADSDTNFFLITTFPFQCTNWNLPAELKHQSPLYVPALCCRQVINE